jgi:hypothetical protein
MVRAELDPELKRAYGVILHGKPRASGTGRLHGHLILANYADGRALKDRYSAMRVEKCSRLAEHTILGERATLGRCHAAVVRVLRKSAPDTCAWLIESFGENPEKPRSAISSRGRQRAERLGVNLPKARATVQRLWGETQNIGAFDEALTRKGYRIEAGNKTGVWILREKRSGLVVGALDRLIRQKRADIRIMMEAHIGQKESHQQRRSYVDGRPWSQNLRSGAQNLGGFGGIETASGASTTYSDVRRSHQPDVESAGADRADAASASAIVRHASVPGIRGARAYESFRALQRFRRGLDSARIGLLIARYEAASQEQIANRFFGDYENAVDAWGIGQVRTPSP